MQGLVSQKSESLEDDDGDDLYIIGRFCLCVTKNEHFAQLSQIKFYFYFQVGFHGYSWFQVGLSWFRFCLFVCLFVTFLLIYGSRSVFMAFHGSGWVFMVPGWFFMVSSKF